MLKEQLAAKDNEIKDLKGENKQIKASKEESEQRLNRQRDILRQNGQELVDAQSQVADLEEKLLQTESMLINAKASWAEAEHERELLKNKLSEVENIMADEIDGGLEAFLNQHQSH